jgi:hypothetical protein
MGLLVFGLWTFKFKVECIAKVVTWTFLVLHIHMTSSCGMLDNHVMTKRKLEGGS